MTGKQFLIASTVVMLLAVLPWAVNAIKFVQCDFASPYKCEVVHGIGVFIPPTSIITVWFNSDKQEGEK